MATKKTKPADVPRKTKVIGASLEPSDLARLDAYGTRMLEKEGLRAKRGTLAAMLIRRGLEAVENEART